MKTRLVAIGMAVVILIGVSAPVLAATFGEAVIGSGAFGFHVQNQSTAAGALGISGIMRSTSASSSSIGVRGINFGAGSGVYGRSNTGAGVFGESTQFEGVRGLAHNINHGAIVGIHDGGGIGVYGTSAKGAGVVGTSTSWTGTYGESVSQAGVWGKSATGAGVQGESRDWIGTYGASIKFDGVFGVSRSSAAAGVSGHNDSGGFGVWANSSTGYGVYSTNGGGGGSAAVYGGSGGYNGTGITGEANNGPFAYGIWGKSTSGFAGVFSGNVKVLGNLSKGGGSFMIDHPLDPANKYLYHSFVESPDMMNIYNGNVTTDAKGNATVTMPAYFEALNRDFRYQLTVIGQFAQAIVGQEIVNNHFSIKTDKPNVKVSWQVTGVRHDPFANANRIPVEQTKPASEQGTYLYPKEQGKPESMGVDYQREQAMKAQAAQRQTSPTR